MSQLAMAGQRREFADFPALLRKHIDSDEITGWRRQPTAPLLVIGARSALSGELRKFNSSKEAIRIERILASARAEPVPWRGGGWLRPLGRPVL